MAVDVVFPKNNEAAFIEMAAKLGYSELCFVYGKEADEKRKKVDALQKKTKIRLFVAGEKKGKYDLAVTRAGFDNRDLLEQAKTDIIFGFEGAGRKDFAFSRNSGLNQVLCKIANDKNVMIGFSFSLILNSKNKQMVIGRVKQNIRLCRKYRVDVAVASFAKDPFEMRSSHDLAAFFICLGMDAGAAKKAIESVSLRISENAEKRKNGYVAEGISVVEG